MGQGVAYFQFLDWQENPVLLCNLVLFLTTRSAVNDVNLLKPSKGEIKALGGLCHHSVLGKQGRLLGFYFPEGRITLLTTSTPKLQKFHTIAMSDPSHLLFLEVHLPFLPCIASKARPLSAISEALYPMLVRTRLCNSPLFCPFFL